MSNPNDRLEPLTPTEALSMYEGDRRGELSKATLRSHGYRITRFIEWCDDAGINNLNNLTGRDIQRYKISRKQEVSTVTVKSHMDTLRVFIRFCEAVDAVRNGLSESVVSPSVTVEENRSESILEPDRIDSILSHLEKYEYATHNHVLLQLLWESGCRVGAAHAIDVEHVDTLECRVELRHNPETDTPLKNGTRGEREVAITTETATLLKDYIDEHRHDVTDDHGRRPLLTTKHGRATRNTLRTWVYRLSRPCMAGRECPHERNPDDCEAVESRMTASKCPDSRSPHAIRRAAVTHWLAQDVPTEAVSDRMNVSAEVIDEHYDKRSARDKMEQRRQYLDDI